MLSDIIDHDRPGTYHRPFTNRQILNDHRSRSNPDPLSQMHVATQSGMGGDVAEIVQHAIVTDRSTGIDNAVPSYHRTGIDYGTGHDDTALSNHGSR